MYAVDVQIGPEMHGGGSAQIQCGYQEVQLYLGQYRPKIHADPQPTARYEMFGANIYVTDEALAHRIFKAVRAGDVKETVKVLTGIFTNYLKDNPDYFTKLADVHYKRGVYEGRLAKAKEIREVLNSA